MHNNIPEGYAITRKICNHPHLMCAHTLKHIPLGEEYLEAKESKTNKHLALSQNSLPVQGWLASTKIKWQNVAVGTSHEPFKSSGYFKSTAEYLGINKDSKTGHTISKDTPIVVWRSSRITDGGFNTYTFLKADSIEVKSISNEIQCNWEDLEDLYEQEMSYYVSSDYSTEV